MTTHCLTKAQRIRTRAEFDITMNAGNKSVARSLIGFVSRSAEQSSGETTSRLGLVVSKKVGNSPQRNRVKRRLRELFRQNPDLKAAALDLVILARPSAGAAHFRALSQDFAQLCDYIRRNTRS